MNPNDTKQINKLSKEFLTALNQLGAINEQPSLEENLLDADIERHIGYPLLMANKQYSIDTYQHYINQVIDAQHYFRLKKRDESTNENPF